MQSFALFGLRNFPKYRARDFSLIVAEFYNEKKKEKEKKERERERNKAQRA